VRTSSWSAILALGITMVACVAGSAFARATIGEPAPPLIVQELDGQTFDLAALRGKVVIVNFWATWCPSCREEMPALNAFYQHYHAQGLEMIGVSADRHHDRDDVIKAMQSVSYPLAMLEDAKDNGFNASALPTTFLIDSAGVVRAKLTPDRVSINEKSLDDLVLPLLPNQGAGQSASEGTSIAAKPATEPNK
jgi:cytochrome c biogenesis protein CcmG/thiol:disulfide interchange protein DsbE